MILLDTNVLIRVDQLSLFEDELAVSAISLAELRFGIERAPDVKARRQRTQELSYLEDVLRVSWLPFDRAAAEGYGRLAAIGGRIQAVIDGRADVGMRQTRLGQAQNSLEGMKATLETQRSRVEDLDLGRAVMDLKVQETNYQVALAVTAKVLQPTLMDFLR